MLTEKVSKEEFIEEFVSKGFDKRIVEDLATRQYHSQLTIQDLQVLELKIKNEIEITRNQLDKRIDKLDNKFPLLYWMFGFNLTFFVAILGMFVTLMLK